MEVLEDRLEELIRQCCVISNKELYTEFESVKDFIDELKNMQLIIRLQGGYAVGFVAYSVKTGGDISKELLNTNIVLEKLLKEHKEDRLGVVELLAVKNREKGRGIGTELVKEVLKDVELRTKATLFKAWDNRANPANKIICSKLGFREVTTLEQYYRKNEYNKVSDESCLVCGEVCKCNVTMFIKEGRHV